MEVRLCRSSDLEGQRVIRVNRNARPPLAQLIAQEQDYYKIVP